MLIKRSDLSKAHLMEFFGTMKNIDTYLSEEDLKTLKLDEVVENVFRPALQQMDEALKQARHSGLTETLAQIDADRDAMIRALSKHLDLFLLYPIPEKAQAAERLLAIVSKYGKNIAGKPDREESAILINLLQDLDTANAKADLELIYAMPWVSKLGEHNDEFVNTSGERNRKEAEYETGKARQSRLQLQEAFTKTVRFFEAQALIGGDSPYLSLSGRINHEIDTVLQSAKQRSAAKNRKPGENGSL